ncbi:hypothetical protein Tcan_00578, partial [Toxocara canis]
MVPMVPHGRINFSFLGRKIFALISIVQPKWSRLMPNQVLSARASTTSLHNFLYCRRLVFRKRIFEVVLLATAWSTSKWESESPRATSIASFSCLFVLKSVCLTHSAE